MNGSMTIGQLSEKVNVPTKTIRFYEEIGLITEPKRAENGYRIYQNEIVDELVVIKNARELGLPIPEIKKLIKGCEKGDCAHSREYLKNEIERFTQNLNDQIMQLQKLKRSMGILKKEIGNCEENTSCNILGQLLKISKGGEANDRSRM